MMTLADYFQNAGRQGLMSTTTVVRDNLGDTEHTGNSGFCTPGPGTIVQDQRSTGILLPIVSEY